MADEKMTRDEERAAGLKRYFTGPACKRGHLSGRLVSTNDCCDCRKLHTKKWRDKNPNKQPTYIKEWRKKNPQKQAEHVKRWCEANPGAQSAISKRWRKKNPEAQAEHTRRWREANPDKLRQISRNWKNSNPDRVSVLRSARRARVRNAAGSHTPEDISRIKALQKGKCACCKKKAKLTVDHIVPLIKGGSNFASNIKMLCRSCNCRKNGQDPLVFMKSLGMLL